MKRKISLLMALFLLLACVQPLTVRAEEIGEVEVSVTYPTGPLEDISKYEKVDPDTSRGGEVEAFEEYNELQLLFDLDQRIKNALLSGEREIDVWGMAIDVNRYKISELIVFSPYLCDGINANFYFNRSSRAWTQIELLNPMNPEETKAHILAIDQKIYEVLNQASEGMSEAEKALAVHDYFACQYEYGEVKNNNGDMFPADSFRSGNLFKNGIGVCQAYAEGYKYILGKLGMECHVTGSEQMNHAWNIVKVDGAYYHVDCTWDDPVKDKLGMAYHQFFLLSDSTIRQREHNGWDMTSLVCSSTKYENAYWTKAASPVVMNGENAFYIEGTFLYKQNRNGQNKTALKDLGKWYVWGNNQSYYRDAFSGLFLHENELYYNTATEIRKISCNGQGDACVYRPDEQLRNGYIYGSKKKAGKIEYQILKDPINDSGNIYTAPVTLKQEVSGIILSQTAIQLREGDSYSLEYHLAPQGAEAQVTWNTSDSSVAGVENGTITAYGAGEATITATTDNGKSASCQVSVMSADVALPFADVHDGDWYQDAVKYVYARNIMTGMNDSEFGPGVKLSRAQFATILYRMQGAPEVWYDWEAFSDVAEGQFYTEAVMWARDSEVITGYEDGRFGPADEITREQMALMMFRYANYLRLNTEERGNLYEFPDADRVSGFAWEAAEWAVGSGLITGDQGKINPRGSAERAQCATVIMRFMEGYGL